MGFLGEKPAAAGSAIGLLDARLLLDLCPSEKLVVAFGARVARFEIRDNLQVDGATKD
jgi:hypothetical protein